MKSRQTIVKLAFCLTAVILGGPLSCRCQTPWQNYGHLYSQATSRPWLIVKCKLANVPNVPAGEDQTIAGLFTPGLIPTGNLLDYFSDVSYGAISLAGSRVLPNWVTSTYTSAQAPPGAQMVQNCASQVNGIANLLAAYTPYGIAVVQNAPINDLGACYYGQSQLQIQGKSYLLACVLLGSNNLNIAIAGHEFGHAFTWNHSYDDTQSNCGGNPGAYCDQFDIMSCINCINFTGKYAPSGPGANVPNLVYLGWIPPTRFAKYEVGQSSASYQITALSHPLSAAPLTVEIAGAQGYSANFYTIEYRKSDGWDQGLNPFCRGCEAGAVLIHQYNGLNAQVCRQRLPQSCITGQVYSYLQDVGVNCALTAGALIPGCSWVDPTGAVSVTVKSFDSANALATVIIATQPGVAPAPGSALAGYWGSDSSQHVNFVDTNGHIHELYIHPGAGWTNNDLTKVASNGTSAVSGSALDGYWGSDSSQHVNFVDGKGHVHELYLHPGAATWQDNDLTSTATPNNAGSCRGGGATAAPSSALAGYWGTDSSQHVNFIDTNRHVHELYVHPGANWEDCDLTAASNGAAAEPGNALAGYWGSDSSQHVNFIDGKGHVHELYLHPGAATWQDNDLTSAAAPNNAGSCRGGGATAAPGSAVASYWGSDSSQHVNFIDTNRHVHELYIHPGANWEDCDLTAASNGTATEPGSPLDGYWGSDSSRHVNFVDSNGHVHELYIHPGAATWEDNDLTGITEIGPATESRGVVIGYWGSDSSQHVDFIGKDGPVYELDVQPGKIWALSNIL